ncbi:c-type cytochrome [Methylosinus sp. H3A]|uniref:CopD family protein n=1 Tax=Methylosinus sp. H3A TaxID=2785786 RepID=UPI0018C2D2DB|nr:c-type cytochrome [Methylosinus sp. H3A]MBG0811821.1 c-type cytochrome [Methylosinus sp. H3A]
MELATLRFVESVLSALAVGLLLLPRLLEEDGARFKKPIAAAAVLRLLFGFGLIVASARNIIPAERPLDWSTLTQFISGTVIGKAWVATQILAAIFTATTLIRLRVDNVWLDRATLGLGLAVIAVVSVTGHAVDDSLPIYTQLSFPFHTLAGLTWIGGLLGLVYWMLTGRGKPPEVAWRLAERWSLVAKGAMLVVLLSGLVLAWETVGSFPFLLATPYGRLLSLKLALLCAALLLALSLARYLTLGASKKDFDIAWYAKIGGFEAACALGLLFVAGWIATITPAAHENNVYWPLPFRVTYAGTWGLKVTPWIDPTWQWGVAGAVLALIAAAAWFAPLPQLRERRKLSTPILGVAAAVCGTVSLSVQSYPETYTDPPIPYTDASVKRGFEAFQANCIPCHGVTGEGNGPMAKALKVPPADLTAPHVATHTLGDIFHWLTYGGQSGVMPPFADAITEDERWDLINYLTVLSNSNQSRFLSPKGVIQWLVAPNFALDDPKGEIVDVEKLRGVPTLVSFARCKPEDAEFVDRVASLKAAAETVKAMGAHHVTVYFGECPADAEALTPSHPDATELTYSIINHYLDEPVVNEIPEGHFLIDRSGFVRARFRHFGTGDGNLSSLKAQIALTAKEPVVYVSPHQH